MGLKSPILQGHTSGMAMAVYLAIVPFPSIANAPLHFLPVLPQKLSHWKKLGFQWGVEWGVECVSFPGFLV